MHTKIDWLSVVFKSYTTNDSIEALGLMIENTMADVLGMELLNTMMDIPMQPNEKSRAPYSKHWATKEQDMHLFCSPKMPHFTVELTGQGCERARSEGWFDEFLSKTAALVSRIDIATDIETTENPRDFAITRENGRTKSSGHFNSPTGETVYIGSQKSERFVRIYRYAAPHPRSHLLRVEHVFRRLEAKAVAQMVVTEGSTAAAQAAGNVYGWTSPLWQFEFSTSSELKAVRPERGGGGTVFWLIKSVAPAFKKMVAAGIIADPQGFFDTYFREN